MPPKTSNPILPSSLPTSQDPNLNPPETFVALLGPVSRPQLTSPHFAAGSFALLPNPLLLQRFRPYPQARRRPPSCLCSPPRHPLKHRTAEEDPPHPKGPGHPGQPCTGIPRVEIHMAPHQPTRDMQQPTPPAPTSMGGRRRAAGGHLQGQEGRLARRRGWREEEGAGGRRKGPAQPVGTGGGGMRKGRVPGG